MYNNPVSIPRHRGLKSSSKIHKFTQIHQNSRETDSNMNIPQCTNIQITHTQEQQRNTQKPQYHINQQNVTYIIKSQAIKSKNLITKVL